MNVHSLTLMETTLAVAAELIREVAFLKIAHSSVFTVFSQNFTFLGRSIASHFSLFH